MADTSILEIARSNHEESERYESALVDLLLTSNNPNKSSHSDQLYKAHKASILLDRITQRNALLLDFYKDNTKERQMELDSLSRRDDGDGDGNGNGENLDQISSEPSTSTSTSTSTFQEFYSRLNKIKDYHSKYPSLRTTLQNKFSGEEFIGKYLDLYQHHERFLNLKNVKKLSYLKYLDSFDKLRGDESEEERVLNRETKKGEAYKIYLSELSTYLLSFLRLTRPLEDIDALESHAESEFERSWEAGNVPGWESEIKSIKEGGVASESSVEGIWCKACNKSFAKQTVFDAHLKGGKHQKAEAKLLSNGHSNSNSDQNTHTNQISTASSSTTIDEKAKKLNRIKTLSSLENLISIVSLELLGIRNETKSNVERKSALTEKERIAEAEAIEENLNPNGNGDSNMMTQEQVEGNDDDDDDEDEKIYNPLKLPLGWDGKPIPFWLYKLHGLGVEFRCEICSDYVYQGRKNFDRHFQEARHAFGMRALGLPNTKQFHEITKIEDALALAERLKRQGKVVAEEEGDAEEVEDEQGNIYTRKTYELLKRQGLI